MGVFEDCLCTGVFVGRVACVPPSQWLMNLLFYLLLLLHHHTYWYFRSSSFFTFVDEQEVQLCFSVVFFLRDQRWAHFNFCSQTPAPHHNAGLANYVTPPPQIIVVIEGFNCIQSTSVHFRYIFVLLHGGIKGYVGFRNGIFLSRYYNYSIIPSTPGSIYHSLMSPVTLVAQLSQRGCLDSGI